MRGVRRNVPREGNQVHLVVGTDTFPAKDRRRMALALLVNAVGGGMSSRLSQSTPVVPKVGDTMDFLLWACIERTGTSLLRAVGAVARSA